MPANTAAVAQLRRMDPIRFVNMNASMGRRLEPGCQTDRELGRAAIRGEAEDRIGVEELGSSHVPARTRVVVHILDEVRFEDEAIADAVREIGFEDVAAGVALGGD